MDINFQKELNEAIYAGETALKSLKDARKYLDSAGNWGLLDIFGGNGFTGIFKHLKLSNANNCMQNAKNDLRRFARELDDIDEKIPNIENRFEMLQVYGITPTRLRFLFLRSYMLIQGGLPGQNRGAYRIFS